MTTPEQAPAERELETLRFTRPRRTSGLIVAGSLAFVAIGAVMIAKGDQLRVLVGWASVLFFGLCAIAAVWGFVSPPYVEASPAGLTVRAVGAGQSAGWDRIGHITLTTINRTEVVKVQSSELVHPWRRRAVAAGDLRVGAGWVSLPAHLGVPGNQLHALLTRYAQTYAPDVRH